MNRLYAYIVRWDDGFAPNPFHGVLTLACCKRVIRRVAQVGDYIVGLSSTPDNHIVYAMRVSETITFDEYWHDPRFRVKRPDMRAGGEKALGDNIYRWDAGKNAWEKAWSQHSREDAAADQWFTNDDTGTTTKVLVGEVFTYWGREAPPVPDSLKFQGQYLPSTFEPVARGHRVNFRDEEVEAFIKWFDGQKRGRLGMPTNGLPSPATKSTGKQGKKC